MKLIITLLVTAALLLSACSGLSNSDDSTDQPSGAGDAQTCEDVGAAALDAVQALLDDLGNVSISDLQKIGSDDQPEIFDDLQQDLDELQDRASELDCAPGAVGDYLSDHVNDLEANNTYAEMVLDWIRQQIENGTNLFDSLGGE